MNQLLLIDSRVHTQPYIDCRKSSVDYIVFDYYTETFNSLCDKIESDKYNQVGLVQHANFTDGFNILRKEQVGFNLDTEPYLTFTSLLEFMTKIKLKGVQTFDFLGCGLYDPVRTPAIFAYLEGASGIDLRASTNLTGSAPGDWIMESDNVNVKSVYWTDEIDQYKGLLNAFANNSSYLILNNTIKDINGNVIILREDIYGNPLNPTINSTGGQIKQIPCSVIVWGDPNAGGDTTIPTDVTSSLTSNVVAVYSNDYSFTALKSDGSIIYWGNLHWQCDSVIPPPSNDNFVAIYSNQFSFAGLRANGTVAAWGGNVSANISNIEEQLNTGSPVVTIINNGGAFCALKADGAVILWGASWYKGSIPGSVYEGSPAVAIYAGAYVWAVLKADDTVVSWHIYNGQYDTSNVTNVKVIYSNSAGFAALKTDGSVVAWGDSTSGGEIPEGLDVTNVKTIYSTSRAFAALKNDGSVVAWGGYNPSIHPQGLTNVKTIYSNNLCFVALKVDGTLFAWGGNENQGGIVPENVSGVVAVYSTGNAFAALKTDGTVIAWGNVDEGGVVPEGLTNVATIFSNWGAFIALKNDKTLVAWGTQLQGGYIGGQTAPEFPWDPPVQGAPYDTSNTVTVYASPFAFTGLKSINATTPVGPNSGAGGPSDPGGGGGGIPGGGMGGGGTTDHFFINDPFTISQTATMFSQSLALPYTNQYDYILDININSVWDSMNNLFTERRFMTEFTHNDSNYDSVHLNVDRTSLASLLTTANVVSISSDNESIYLDHAGVYGTLDNQNGQLAGFRFLEIVATKIFGHAKTKIAIENSNEYYINDYVNANTAVNSLIGQIAKGIFNSVITKKIDIMNDYIATDRLEDNTHNAPLININGYPHPFMEFNFNDTVWEFPIVFHTELSSTSNIYIDELNNGPDVGGTRLANGSVDVPVLLRFSA